MDVVLAIDDCTGHVAVRSSLLVLEMHEIAQFTKEFSRLRWQLVENQMANPLDGEPSIKMGSFRIQQKVLFSVKKLIPGSGHVLIFAVLTDLTKIQITAVAPISYTNKVKVRWDKDKSLIHYVLFEIRHHPVGEIVETIVYRSTD